MKSLEKSINSLGQTSFGCSRPATGNKWLRLSLQRRIVGYATHHCNPALLHIDKGQTEMDGGKAEARGTKDLCHQASDMEETVQVESSIYIYLVHMWVCFCTCMCGQHVVHVC